MILHEAQSRFPTSTTKCNWFEDWQASEWIVPVKSHFFSGVRALFCMETSFAALSFRILVSLADFLKMDDWKNTFACCCMQSHWLWELCLRSINNARKGLHQLSHFKLSLPRDLRAPLGCLLSVISSSLNASADTAARQCRGYLFFYPSKKAVKFGRLLLFMNLVKLAINLPSPVLPFLEASSAILTLFTRDTFAQQLFPRWIFKINLAAQKWCSIWINLTHALPDLPWYRTWRQLNSTQ